MLRDEFIGDRAGEATMPAFAIQPKEMIPIRIGFADPQFTDRAAVGQKLIHVKSSAIGCRVRSAAFPGESPCDEIYGALQQMLGTGKFRKPSLANNACLSKDLLRGL